MLPTEANYRPDIDGLRAIAVLAVVAFHAFPERVPGGFVGVDVFFVISGYLITGLIAAAVAGDRFSYLAFYARRARRIFPALILVLLTTMLLSWFTALPDEYARLGVDGVGGALFSANFVFWHEAGYFDVASQTKPLLHLWSLGVEEQFYLAWPFVLVGIMHLRRRRMAVVGGIAGVSFLLNVMLVRTNPVAAFNAPWTRVWELMIGALLALWSSSAGGIEPTTVRASGVRDLMSLTGFALIAWATMTFSPELAFPGWYALAPSVGAALIIAAGPLALLNRALLARRAAVFIGLISYPLYLWHWPLLVFAGFVPSLVQGPLSTMVWRLTRVGIVLLSFVIAYLTYRLVELPLRRRADLNRVAARLAFGLALTACVAVVIALHPTPLRSGDAGTAMAMEARRDWGTPISPDAPFYATGSRAPDVLFVGDSHAEQYFPAVKHAAEGMARAPTVVFSTKGGCPFLPLVSELSCGAVYRRSMALARQPSVHRVVIAGAWPVYFGEDFVRTGRAAWLGRGKGATLPDVEAAFQALTRDIAGLRAMGKDVVLITSHPNMPSADPVNLAAPLRLPFTRAPAAAFAPFSLAEFRTTAAWVDARLATVARESGATLLSPADSLCAGDVCPVADSSGRPLRMDDGHFRPFAVIRYFTWVPSLVAWQGVDGH